MAGHHGISIKPSIHRVWFMERRINKNKASLNLFVIQFLRKFSATRLCNVVSHSKELTALVKVWSSFCPYTQEYFSTKTDTFKLLIAIQIIYNISRYISTSITLEKPPSTNRTGTCQLTRIAPIGCNASPSGQKYPECKRMCSGTRFLPSYARQKKFCTATVGHMRSARGQLHGAVM